MFSVKLLRNPTLKIALRDALVIGQPFSQCCCQLNDKWRLMSAVTLERFPTLTQEKNQMQQRFQLKLNEIEYENSLLSDHELRHIEDQKLAERLKQVDYEETETEAIMQTAKEVEDKWEAEEAAFTPASRITEDDKTNNLKSTNRKLDRKLTLLVKQKMGERELWVMPQGELEEGESMRQSAERVLSELCGNGVRAKFVSNAPCGYLKYPLPHTEREKDGAVGAKVFFYKAQLQAGSVSPNEHVTDFVWVTKNELKDYVPKAYLRKVNQFVLEF